MNWEGLKPGDLIFMINADERSAETWRDAWLVVSNRESDLHPFNYDVDVMNLATGAVTSHTRQGDAAIHPSYLVMRGSEELR